MNLDDLYIELAQARSNRDEVASGYAMQRYNPQERPISQDEHDDDLFHNSAYIAMIERLILQREVEAFGHRPNAVYTDPNLYDGRAYDASRVEDYLAGLEGRNRPTLDVHIRTLNGLLYHAPHDVRLYKARASCWPSTS